MIAASSCATTAARGFTRPSDVPSSAYRESELGTLESGRAELRRDRVGEYVHLAVGLAYRLPRTQSPDPYEIASALVPGWMSSTHTAALVQRVGGALSDYLRFFWRSPAWAFIAEEEHIGDQRVDLIFATNRAVEIDEIKVATGSARIDDHEMFSQAKAQADVGRGMFGTAFRGVHLIALERRPRHCLVRPNTRRPRWRSAA